MSQVFNSGPTHTHLCRTKGADETTVIGLNLQERPPNPITFQQMTHMCWVALVTQSQPLVYKALGRRPAQTELTLLAAGNVGSRSVFI